jgi:hypothetical protein
VKRVVTILLQVGLLLAAANAVLFCVRIALQQVLGFGRWYWGGAFAVFVAPAALALALQLYERVDAPTRPETTHA